MRTNHVPKDVSERDSALSWFESLILAFEHKAVSNQGFETRKRGVLDVDSRRKPDSRISKTENQMLFFLTKSVCPMLLEETWEVLNQKLRYYNDSTTS